jgi:hypothetical protein
MDAQQRQNRKLDCGFDIGRIERRSHCPRNRFERRLALAITSDEEPSSTDPKRTRSPLSLPR